MKQIVKGMVNLGVSSGVRLAERSKVGRYVLGQVRNAEINRTSSVHHQGTDLIFAVPNNLNQIRIDTFATKEPETLEWIDGIPKGSVVWDIGANIGLYSCYAARARGCRVFSFEPSVFNLELLARNIFLNQLSNQVTIIPLPLSDAMAVRTLSMSSTEWGGALSTFGETYGHDGLPLQKVFEFQTLGVSMVDAVERLEIPQPDFIKMDVDGIEHLILKGGASVLKKAKAILLEIDEDFEQQSVDSTRFLKEAGLVLQDKRHSAMFDNSDLSSCYNQVWQRPSAG